MISLATSRVIFYDCEGALHVQRREGKEEKWNVEQNENYTVHVCQGIIIIEYNNYLHYLLLLIIMAAKLFAGEIVCVCVCACVCACACVCVCV